MFKLSALLQPKSTRTSYKYTITATANDGSFVETMREDGVPKRFYTNTLQKLNTEKKITVIDDTHFELAIDRSTTVETTAVDLTK